MGSRSSCSALAVAAAVAFLVAGCGGAASPGKSGAAALLRCRSGSSGDLLWSSSTVYFADGRRVVSSGGTTVTLPRGAVPAGFRACGAPVVLYLAGNELRAKALAAGRSRRPLLLGRKVALAPDGRLVSFSGTTIRSTGAATPVRRLPPKWELVAVVASPRDPGTFLVSAQSPEAGIELCGTGLGAIYRVSADGTRTLLVDNPCHDSPQPAFSPDGSTISYLDDASNTLYTVGAAGTGRHRVATRGKVVSYLWSPDGRRIAYESRAGSVSSVWVSTLGGGTRRLAAGDLAGWSSDGRDVAVVSGRSLVGVPVAGGRPHALLRL